MGEQEKILWADDRAYQLASLIRATERDGHITAGVAGSVDEVRDFVQGDKKFTLAIVDANMPKQNDGEEAAGIIRASRPGVKVVSLSTDVQKWGDENWSKDMSLAEIRQAIRNI